MTGANPHSAWTCRTSSPVRTKDAATQSTPSSRPSSRSSWSLAVTAGVRRSLSGKAAPFRSARAPPTRTRAVSESAATLVTSRTISPSARTIRSPSATSSVRCGYEMGMRRSAPHVVRHEVGAARRQLDGAAGNRHTQLRALDVLEDRDVAPLSLRRVAPGRTAVGVVVSMGEIQPGDVHPGIDQRLHPFVRARRRPQRGHDLGASHSGDGSGSRAVEPGTTVSRAPRRSPGGSSSRG